VRIGPFGIWEILIILALVLMLFGPRKLPELARGIGQAINEFRRGVREISTDLEREMNEETTRQAKPAAAAAQAAAAEPQPAAEAEPAHAAVPPGVTAPVEPEEAAERQVRG